MRNASSSPASTAEFDYRAAAGKSENGYTPRFLQINKYLNRPLAWLIVRAVFRTPVTPNGLTYAAFVLELTGAGLFLVGRPPAFLAAGILAQVSSIVDCADGMLARARDRRSEFGAYLDLLLDRIGEFCLLLAYVFGLHRYLGRPGLLAFGLVTVGLYFLMTTVFYLTKAYFRDARQGEAAENRGWLMFLVALFAVVNRMDIGVFVLFAVAAGACLTLAARFFIKRRAEAPSAPRAT